MSRAIKKLFKHGGSYAIDIPKEFVKETGVREVIVEYNSKRVNILPKTELDTLESDPLFTEFINALANDAMKHPEKLHDVKEVWDKEWDKLLEDITDDE